MDNSEPGVRGLHAGVMDTSGPFTPPSGLAQFGDRGAWAQRGRRVTEPVTGENFVLLPLPADADAERSWTRLIESLTTVEVGPLRPPRSTVNDDDDLWLLFEDLPEHTLAHAIGQLGGGVQGFVLPALSQALRAIGQLHDHGFTLRRFSLRDLVSEPPMGENPWSLIVTPDSGVRPFGVGHETEEIRGDLIMVAAAAATVLTGRRPSAGRIRTPLRTVCPSLPPSALDALDAVLDDLDTAVPRGAGDDHVDEAILGTRGSAARALADQLAVDDQLPSTPMPSTQVDREVEEDTETLPPVAPTRPRVLVDDDESAPPTAADRLFSVLGQDPRGGRERVRQPVRRREVDAVPPVRPWGSQPKQVRAPDKRKKLMALVAAAVMISGGAAAWWGAQSQDSPMGSETTAAGQSGGSQVVAPAPSNPAPSSAAAATAEANTDVEQAVADLVKVRAQALREHDAAALQAVYTEQSPALEADQRTLEELDPDPVTGQHAFSDLSMEVQPGSTQVRQSTPTSAVVTTAVDARGITEGQATSQDIEATVVKTQNGWRLETVKPR